jgi:hypothetical protein
MSDAVGSLVGSTDLLPRTSMSSRPRWKGTATRKPRSSGTPARALGSCASSTAPTPMRFRASATSCRRRAWTFSGGAQPRVCRTTSPRRRGYRRAMPRALTVCSVPGCPHARPCPEHPATNRRGSTRAWRRVREQALQRDRFRCVECGAFAVEVDHIIERERGGRDVLGNLRSLCGDCHAERHGRAKTA